MLFIFPSILFGEELVDDVSGLAFGYTLRIYPKPAQQVNLLIRGWLLPPGGIFAGECSAIPAGKVLADSLAIAKVQKGRVEQRWLFIFFHQKSMELTFPLRDQNGIHCRSNRQPPLLAIEDPAEGGFVEQVKLFDRNWRQVKGKLLSGFLFTFLFAFRFRFLFRLLFLLRFLLRTYLTLPALCR